MIGLDELNRLDDAAFVDLLGAVFEHSPWVAVRARAERPFGSLPALHDSMMQAVRGASRDEQLALLRAHPELAGHEAADGELTADSTSEQGRLGFTALSKSELAGIAYLNRAYREKFGFPAIVALALHASRATVLAEIERRTANDLQDEVPNALDQVAHITRARLRKIVEGD
jgi:chitin deacetylase